MKIRHQKSEGLKTVTSISPLFEFVCDNVTGKIWGENERSASRQHDELTEAFARLVEIIHERMNLTLEEVSFITSGSRDTDDMEVVK